MPRKWICNKIYIIYKMKFLILIGTVLAVKLSDDAQLDDYNYLAEDDNLIELKSESSSKEKLESEASAELSSISQSLTEAQMATQAGQQLLSLTKAELQIETEAESNLQTASSSLANLYDQLEKTLSEDDE